MIKDVYRKYFQKSFTFLYPLLAMKRNKGPYFKPLQTYICWEGTYMPDSRKLVCVYKRDNTDKWKNFEKDVLMNHELLDHSVPINEDKVIYVFDLNIYKEDYDLFLKGHYSKLSDDAKQLMMDYYGIHTPEWVFIDSYLFPENYFSIYADILGIDEDMLIGVGELCTPYDCDKEVCLLKSLNVVEIIKTNTEV